MGRDLRATSHDRLTSFDIAQLAGVSQPTVSRALRGDVMVSEATRKRIEAIASQLNYKVDKHASSLRLRQSNTLALLFFEDPTSDNSLINPFYLSMLGSITRTCGVRGYDLLISFQQLSSDWHVEYADSSKADGIILLGYGDYDEYRWRLERLVAQGTHFVRWGSMQASQPYTTLGTDNVEGGAIAARHLLALGHRAIAFLGEASSRSPEFEQRYLGAIAAMRAAGVASDPMLQVDAISTEESGYAAARALIARHIPFEAVFAASDLIAVGALRALEEQGLSVPGDVSIVGFDDISAASLSHPPLTTVAQDYARAGRCWSTPCLARSRHGRPRSRCRRPGSSCGARPRRVERSVEREAASGLLGAVEHFLRLFGIQIGFALQNANMSRIFQSLGTDVDDLAFLWIAAPLTGLIVQPLIGQWSDRTWTRLGRRRPFFLGGAVLAMLALFGMPNAPALGAAALLLWVLDASLNIAMEPFRAFVGDMLDTKQQTSGYAFQTAFIGAGAVIGSLAPKLLTHGLHLANSAPMGVVPPSVRWAFYLGGLALFAAVLWTVMSTREYPPDRMSAFGGRSEVTADASPALPADGWAWLAAGTLVCAGVGRFGLDKPVYLLGGILTAFGLARIGVRARGRAGRSAGTIGRVMGDLAMMPRAMERLCLVQFCTWSALFIMWIYTTPIVAQDFFGSADASSANYNAGADWVGILFAVYNGVAALWAFAMPRIARRIGPVNTHMLGLGAGAAGFASFLVLRDPDWLIASMVLIGIAWGSILTMPYAILARTLPPAKLGVYMGLFNIFIVVPQLIVASVMGNVLRLLSPGNPKPAMAIAAGVLVLAAIAMRRVAGVMDAGEELVAQPRERLAVVGEV